MNFDFLKSQKGFEKLYTYCNEAEQFAVSYPASSARASRTAMEYIVKLIYQTKVDGDTDSKTVFEMLTDPFFEGFIGDETVMSTFHYIRKMGNAASHGEDITAEESMEILEQLHFLIGEAAILLGLAEDYPVFEKPGAFPSADDKKAVSVTEKKVEVEPELVARFADRMRNTRFNVKNKRDESENKKLFLKATLREAGWPIVNKPDQAMPCSAGTQMFICNGNKADYVLYGKDKKPLAVVVYCDNPIEGRKMGVEMADELEKNCQYKPIVYYFSGYHCFCIDQLGYPDRRVYQLHTLSELELFIQRAKERTDISAPKINNAITNRDYQKKAITAACKAFNSKRRSSLLVMATGTGKTRVAISIVDVLMKANWVKNVLFLADRTSLVRQANKNFNKLLPNVTTSVYSGGSLGRDANARIIFSTYQTMIKLIEDDTREFKTGRFDLIIIDEAHRSIFNKYAALFNYFDSLIIGLTATPRCEDNKSTYQMFKLPNGQPDFAYELEEAIKDHYLVGFTIEDKTTDLMRRGIKYDDLSDDDKAKLEDGFDYDEKVDYSGADIEKNSFNAKGVINLGTIDAMLNELMTNGIKINSGDKLGKTIIFSSCHEEAEQIVLEFNRLYPRLGSDFCKLIDSKVENNLNLIDSFSDRDSMPQIAVSVDMMDTGIDVPDVLNLVFFKGVRSKIKFLQMIGRGTRLCPDVFGPTIDKKGFLIFDYFDNFRYFSTGNTWSTSGGSANPRKSYTVTPQSQLINREKLSLLRILQDMNKRTAFEEKYYAELKEYFINELRSLCNDRINVTYNMAYVNKYRTAELWNSITDDVEAELINNVIPLMDSISEPAKVKTFDLLMLTIEHEYIARQKDGKDPKKIKHGFNSVANLLNEYMEELLKLKTIPEIVKKEKLIKDMRHGDYVFDNFSIELCENVRKELRGLVSYIKDDRKYYIINVHDMIIDDSKADTQDEPARRPYAEKANEYLNGNDPVLAKIRSLDELTDDEKKNLEAVFKTKLGTEAEYAAWSGNAPLAAFIRSKIGIDDNAIQTKFGSILNDKTLNEAQLDFLNQIISYAKENGDVTFIDLQKVSPFCDYDIMELFGEKKELIKQLVNGLHKPVM